MLRLSLDLFGDTQLSSPIFSVSCAASDHPLWSGEHGHRGSLIISMEPCPQRPPSGCCHVHVQPFTGAVRHSVLFSTEGDAGSRAATRASVFAELRDCPANLRTPQQIAAFLILRCRLFAASYAVARLVSQCLWLGDAATASALVLYMKGLEAMPTWTSRGRLERLAAVAHRSSTPTAAGETLVRIAQASNAPAVLSAPVAVPLDVCIITTADLRKCRRVLETILLSQLDDADRVAVLGNGQELVPPSWGKEGRLAPRGASAVDAAGPEALEKMWVRAAGIFRLWLLQSSAAGSMLPRLDGKQRLQVILFLVDRTGEKSWSDADGSFSVPDFVKKNPAFFGVQISCLFIVPPSAGAAQPVGHPLSATSSRPKSPMSRSPRSSNTTCFDATNDIAAVTFETCGSVAVVEDEDHLVSRAVSSVLETSRRQLLSAIIVIVIPQHASQAVFVDSSPVFKVLELPKAASRAHMLGPLFLHPTLQATGHQHPAGLRSVTRCLRVEWNGPLPPSVLVLARSPSEADGSWDAAFLQTSQSYLDAAVYGEPIRAWTSTLRLFRDVLSLGTSQTASSASSAEASSSAVLAMLQHHLEAGLIKRDLRDLARRIHATLAGRGVLEGKLILLSWLSRLMNANAMDVADEVVAPVLFSEPAATAASPSIQPQQQSGGGGGALPSASAPSHQQQHHQNPSVPNLFVSEIYHAPASETDTDSVPPFSARTDQSSHDAMRAGAAGHPYPAASKRDVSSVSVGTPHSSVATHDAPRRPPVDGADARARPPQQQQQQQQQQHQAVMMVTRVRSNIADDSSSDGDDADGHRGTNDSIQIITSAQAVESVLANSSRQFQGPVRPSTIHELYVDPRWVRLGKETPAASSFEAVITRLLPPGTVTKNSFSLRLAALRRGTAYVEFAPQFEPLKAASHRRLLLLEVDGASQLQLIKSDPISVAHPLPQEHTFASLKRGAEYCIVHLASTRPPAEWIALEDLVVADGVQFRTPLYAVDSLTVTEVFSRSASIQWEGNAPSYIVSLTRLRPASAASSAAREAHEDAEDDNVTQTFSSSTGFVAFTSLAPSSLYRVQVMPQQKVELGQDGGGCGLVLGIEPLDGYFSTSIEPEFSNVKVRATCGKAIGSIALLATHPAFDIVYPDYFVHIEPLVLLNAMERTELEIVAGRPVDLEVHFVVVVRSRETGGVLLEKRAGGPLKAALGPFDAVISVEVQNIEDASAEVFWTSTGSDHTISAALAQPVDLDDDYEEQHLAASGDTRKVLLQHLRPATDYVVKVSGRSCVNIVSALLRTLPSAPRAGECNIRHSLARKELRIALPADGVTAAAPLPDDRSVMHRLHLVPARSPGTPAGVDASSSSSSALLVAGGSLAVHHQIEGLAVLIKPGMRSLVSGSNPTVVVEDVSRVGPQGVVVEVSKTLRVQESAGLSSASDNSQRTVYTSAPRVMTAVTNIAAFVDEQADVVEFRWTAVSVSGVFTVGLGSSFLTISGLRATFPLPRDLPSMFSVFSVSGVDVIPEDSPLYFAAPPPPPSRGLFLTKALHEDSITLEVHPSIDSILEQVPAQLRDQIDVCLEFDTPCFLPVVVQLPLASPAASADATPHHSGSSSLLAPKRQQTVSAGCVELPLLLNRHKDAAITVRFIVRNKKSPGYMSDLAVPPSTAAALSHASGTAAVASPPTVVAMNEPVVLNASVMKSLTTSIPTPIVFGITNLDVTALQPTSCALRWASLNPLHEVVLVSNDDFKFAAKTIQPEIVLTDLSPQTVYHLVVRGSESGAHRAELTFCTPPELTTDELGQIANTVVVDGRRLTCELRPTFQQRVAVHGVEGVLRSQRRLLLWSQPPVEWVTNDHTKTVCTASLTRPDLRHGEAWPYITVEGCCAAEQLGPVVCASPSHAAQQYRIDLVGLVSLELREAGAQAVLTWSGSADSYVLTMRVGRTQETQIHRKMSPRHVFETAAFRGQLLYFLLRAEGPSNVARFSVAVPPPVAPLRVVHYVPTQLTFMVPPPVYFDELEGTTHVVVDDAKYEHSGASGQEESVTVQLTPPPPPPPQASTTGTTGKKPAAQGPAASSAARRLDLVTSGSPPTRGSAAAINSSSSSRSPSAGRKGLAVASTPPSLSLAAAPEPLVLAITLTVLVRPSADMTEYVCLNPKLEVPLRQPLAILKHLQAIALAHITPMSAEVTWRSDDTEFAIEATSYQPIPLGADGSVASGQSPSAALNFDEAEEDGDGGRASASRGGQQYTPGSVNESPAHRNETDKGIASHRKFIVASPIVRLRNLLPATMHTLIVRGRQCGDAVIQLSFLTPPVFHENSVVLRRHRDGTACSILADFPVESFRCGPVSFLAETRVELYDEFGDKQESLLCKDGHCKFQLSCALTAVHCVRAVKAVSGVDAVLGHHLANADPCADMLLAKIPKMSVMRPLRLVLCETNALRVAWGCSSARARFTLTATPVASVNAIGGAPVPKRILTCDGSCEASIPSLTPATLYELHVIEDCSYAMFPNPAEQTRVVIHDDAPPAPHVLAHALTAPKRAAQTTTKRYFGGLTLALNAERRVHQTAHLALFSAIRVIPDNTVFVTVLPHTTSCQLPNPTLLTSNARPTFVSTNGNPGAEQHTVDITLTEPAGTLTHRLEYFHACEVLPESPYSETTLNSVQFSDPEVQPVELIRTIHKAHVTHTTNHKVELQWEATNEKMRCDVSLSDLLRPSQPEIIHRVTDNQLIVDGLSSGTAYGVTITPSYYNVPCEPLSLTVLTAPKRPKAPKVNIAMLNAIFDIAATSRQAAPPTQQDLLLTTTHTALVICSKESDVSECHSATDFLNKTQTKNVFKSADIVQRVDLRLRSGKNYVFVFFSSVHHPCSHNGILHSKPTVIMHNTDCYSPQNLHMVTRSKNSITVGWSSVDTGSKILRFQVEMVPVFAKFVSAETTFAKESPLQQQPQQSELSPANRRGGAKAQRGADGVSQLYGKRKDPNSEAPAAGAHEASAADHHQRASESSAFHASSAAQQHQQQLLALFDDEENKKVVAVDCTVDKPAMHCTFSFLQQGLGYAFRVRQIAADTGVASAWSSVLQVETMQPPKPVERLQVIAVGPTSFQIAWVDKQGGGAAESMTYLVQCKAERAGAASAAAAGPLAGRAVERTVHTTSCEVDGLLNATQYRVTVVPCNIYGESCMANNATLVVRTEAPVNWRI